MPDSGRLLPEKAKRPPFWRRYWVGVDGGLSAGNVTRRFALRYAEGQASFGKAAVVMRHGRNGTIHVVREFLPR